MEKRGADWWAKLVGELAESGGDVEGVARKHGVRARTLAWWRSELARRARKETSPRLLPVVVDKSESTGGRGALDVTVETDAGRVRIRGVLSPEQPPPSS